MNVTTDSESRAKTDHVTSITSPLATTPLGWFS
jgi:hypothetical protein